MNAGDAADQVLRQLDKMIRNSERASRDFRLNKVIHSVIESLLFVIEDQNIRTSSCEIYIFRSCSQNFLLSFSG